jgi:calcineurin-like phosphoesterase family protein
MVFNLGDMHSMFTGVDAIWRGFLDVQTQHLAGVRPLIFVRGNHETLGVSSRLFDSWLGHPSGKSHFLMRYGDVAFMIVDTGEVGAGLYNENKNFGELQKEWIKKSLLAPEFADASFKVLLCHIPPNGGKKTKAMFDGCFQKAQPDLMLCGHIHRPQFFKAGEVTPFPLCIGYGALVLKSTQKNIELISIDWRGKTVGKWRFTKRKGK